MTKARRGGYDFLQEEIMKISELKQKAKADMKNGYGYAILTMILLNLTLLGSMTIGLLIGFILVAGAVQCCYITYFNDVAMNKREGIDSTYRGFRQFARALVLYLWELLFFVVPLLVIGIILLIIGAATGNAMASGAGTVTPQSAMTIAGIILGLIYLVYFIWVSLKLYFSFYILNDEVDLSALNCIKKSFAMTKKKMVRLFLFELSFIGWWLLCLITFGGMYLYVYPYYMTAKSNLYFDTVGKTSAAAE